MTIADGCMVLMTCSSTTRAVGQERPAAARDHLDRVERVDVAARHHAAEVGRLAGIDRVVVHDVQRIALLPHVQPGQRAPGAADGVERRLAPFASTFEAASASTAIFSAFFSDFSEASSSRRPPSGNVSPSPILAPLTSTTSRLPPPRSPATPSGSWKPEMTPSADRRASSAPREDRDLDAGDRLDRGDELRRRWRPRAPPPWRARAAR